MKWKASVKLLTQAPARKTVCSELSTVVKWLWRAWNLDHSLINIQGKRALRFKFLVEYHIHVTTRIEPGGLVCSSSVIL